MVVLEWPSLDPVLNSEASEEDDTRQTRKVDREEENREITVEYTLLKGRHVVGGWLS